MMKKDCSDKEQSFLLFPTAFVRVSVGQGVLYFCFFSSVYIGISKKESRSDFLCQFY